METEIFKDIPGYEGLYQVSNLGRIYSFPKNGSGGHKGKIKNIFYQNSGYQILSLCKKSKRKSFLVHRLVAEVFIPNLENKKTVNHKNGIRDDNRVENLEWNSYQENLKHKFNILGCKGTWLGITGDNHPRAKKVNQYDLDGNFIKTWNSVRNASIKLNINYTSIFANCNGIQKKAGCYTWKFYNYYLREKNNVGYYENEFQELKASEVKVKKAKEELEKLIK